MSDDEMTVTNSNSIEQAYMVALCRYYLIWQSRVDYYATTIGVSLVAAAGILGNAATLLTLSGRRLTTATFVYYRTIAMVDLCRCAFVITYVLRVLLPFRRYYWSSWYEAHVMYFVLAALGFVSTTLAVSLCFRLCFCIIQSTRMKRTRSSPAHTRRIIYATVITAIVVNLRVCFEQEVAEDNEDKCEAPADDNDTGTAVDAVFTYYRLQPSQFGQNYFTWLRAVHNIPMVILLVLLAGTVLLLALCVSLLPGLSGGANQSILTNDDPALRASKPWRTQRQMCHLFMLLSICYAISLLPSLLNEVLFSSNNNTGGGGDGSAANSLTSDMEHQSASAAGIDRRNDINNTLFNIGVGVGGGGGVGGAEVIDHSTNNNNNNNNDDDDVIGQTFDHYESQLRYNTRQRTFGALMNVVQNLAHALSFYVYITCSEAFRNEFRLKLARFCCEFRAWNGWPLASFELPSWRKRHSSRGSPLMLMTASTTLPAAAVASSSTVQLPEGETAVHLWRKSGVVVLDRRRFEAVLLSECDDQLQLDTDSRRGARRPFRKRSVFRLSSYFRRQNNNNNNNNDQQPAIGGPLSSDDDQLSVATLQNIGPLDAATRQTVA